MTQSKRVRFPYITQKLTPIVATSLDKPIRLWRGEAIHIAMRLSVKELRSLVREAIMDGWTTSKLLRRRGFTEDHGREILKLHAKMMRAIGVDPDSIDSLPVLGSGTKGIVYGVGENALKVTHDRSEAETSANLIGAQSSAIANIYAVIEFSNPNMPKGYFGIFQEKLIPLSKQEADRFDEYVQFLNFPGFLTAADYDLRDAIQMSIDYNIHKGKSSSEIKKLIDSWKIFATHWNIEGIVKELNKNGIKFHDYHAGNLMMRPDGTYVIIDLGYSRSMSSTGKIQKVFETYVKSVLESKR